MKSLMKIRYLLPLLPLLFIQFCTDGDIAEELLMSKAKTISLPFSSSDDATIAYTIGGTVESTDTSSDVIQVGENSTDPTAPSVGYVCFETSLLTSNGITSDRIIMATISIWRVGGNGTPEARGPLCVDHVDVPTFPSTILANNIATLPVNGVDTWTVIPVTPQLKVDITNSRNYTSFSLYLDTCDGNTLDIIKFASGDNSDTTIQPRMVVYYL